MPKKTVFIILDGVGAGELPDAHIYNDQNTNTLANLAQHFNGISLPNLQKLGLGNIIPIKGIQPQKNPTGNFGKMTELSKGKDSTTGHWEIGGIVQEKPFPTFTKTGFPNNIIQKFENAVNKRTIGNYAASGTKIIQDLGDEHCETGNLIVYTSADSVFQIAAHEEVVPLKELYKICEIARNEVFTDEFAVSRIIARPFLGKSGNYFRTENRHDYSLKPQKKTFLDIIENHGLPVTSIGKIYDLFAGQGITESVISKNNTMGMKKTLEQTLKQKEGLIFTNLVDFDMLWGHRNNPEGFYTGLKEFDQFLPELINALGDDDMLVLTADHGNDPTNIKSTDHTREYVPILVFGKNLKQGVDLGIRKTFADAGKTVLDFLGIENDLFGESFLTNIIH